MATKLSEEQSFALDVVLKKHNVAITGQAGTGKSFLLRAIVEHMDRKCALLCTTGIGCTQFFDLHATTVHCWAGLYDGRYDNNTLKELVMTDDKYEQVRKNVKQCEVIIIDEISMLSKKDFNQLELVCRNVKDNQKLFGGIQIVACGDFYQLPPVANPFYKDSGDFCFESNIWQSVFKHNINLTKVMRQSEPLFIKAVRETALGSVSKESDEFLQTLDGDLPEHFQPVHLFPRNTDAALYNNRRLDELKTTGRTYTALKNNGRPKYQKKILAPHHLSVKIHCPVILLRNLGGKLVNGLQGRVKSLNDETITVYFPKINETHNIERYNFTIYDVKKKCNVAERLQFPLTLAFALTIHKSQGMTLDSVIVHCEGIFLPGQLSVAIGRARSSEGVKLVNYRKGLCFQHKNVVNKYYGTPDNEYKENAICCQDLPFAKEENPECVGLTDSEDSDVEMLELDRVENIDISKIPLLSTDIDINGLLKTVNYENPITPQQEKINKICSALSNDFLEIFLAKQYDVIKGILDENLKEEGLKTQAWTSIMRSYHQYLISEEFQVAVPLLFAYETGLSDDHRFIASRLTFQLLQDLIHAQAKQTVIDPTRQRQLGQISEAGKAKIRYVGGMCVAKTRTQLNTVIHTNLGNRLAVCRKKVETAETQLNFIYKLEASHEERKKSDPSLEEIERKQNVTQCLTYISDQCFSFFILLDSKISSLLTIEKFKEQKENIFENSRCKLREDKDIEKIWRTMCGKTINYEESNYVFEDLVKRYLMVRHKQFLKDTKSHYNVIKKKRLREDLDQKKSKNTEENETPSTSKEPPKKKAKCRPKTPSKGKGKGKGRPKKVKYYCGLCSSEYHQDEEWIQCDECDTWYHRLCAGLEDEEAWEKIQDPDVEYKCHQCH